MCKCIKCGKYCDCSEKYCKQCLIDEVNATKNLDVGGHFYGEKLEEKQ